MSDVRKNYLYSVLYQFLTIIVPLITTPYLSRTLGAEKVGIYSYTNSIVQYFVLISMLGILDYGNRTIAACKNKEERSKTFGEIFFIQLFTSIVALILYNIYVYIDNNTYKIIAIIQGIAIVSSLLDINWFFFGIERFKLTVTRNMVIKILSLIFIFLFVIDSDDLWKYVLIMVSSTLLSNLILWLFLKNEINIIKLNVRQSIRHLGPCFILMIPLLSRSIFVYLDKTMLGLLAGMTETGYYEYSEKIILAATSILTSLGTVMLPRISSLVAMKKEEEARKITSLSMDFIAGIGMPLTLGILAVSDSLVNVFLGESYSNCNIVNVMAITIILVGWTNVIRTQYILPYKKDKVYTLAVILGAIIDFFVNFLLIPSYGAFGAAIGWVCAEVVITLTQTYCASKYLPICQYLKNCFGFFVNAIIMFIIVKYINFFGDNSLTSLLFELITGIFSYTVLTVIYVKSFRKDLWNQFKNILHTTK